VIGLVPEIDRCRTKSDLLNDRWWYTRCALGESWVGVDDELFAVGACGDSRDIVCRDRGYSLLEGLINVGVSKDIDEYSAAIFFGDP